MPCYPAGRIFFRPAVNRLTETAAAVVETVDLQITVAIPLVGGKIEGLLADLMTKALTKENEVGLDWLG